MFMCHWYVMLPCSTCVFNLHSNTSSVFKGRLSIHIQMLDIVKDKRWMYVVCQHILFGTDFLTKLLSTINYVRREQDNSPQDNCPPQIFFSFIFSFWLPLSDSMNSIALLTILSLQNTLLFKPVLSLYLALIIV